MSIIFVHHIFSGFDFGTFHRFVILPIQTVIETSYCTYLCTASVYVCSQNAAVTYLLKFICIYII